MTYTKQWWPAFAAHDVASCFNCGSDFGLDSYWYDSGHIAGNGRYACACVKCGYTTYYDLPGKDSK